MKQGWEESTLGEVYDVRDGTHDSPKYKPNGYPLITSKNLKKYGLSFEKVKFISEEDYLKINARSEVHRGDILFAMIGTIGNPIIVEVEPNFSIKNVALFKVPKDQDNYFLKYYLESQYVQSKMKREAKGTTQKFVGLGYLRIFPISYPPLPEQKRIVAILDKALTGIDAATANAEKNLKNARELFESYLNSVFTEKGEGWTEKKLGDVCNVVGGGTPSKSNELFYTGNIPWATVRDMKSDVIANTECNITKDAILNSSTNVISKNNVIIATRVGLGKVCLIERDTAINQDLRGVIPKNSTQISVMFLYWWFKSISHLIEAEGTGATVKGVKLPFIKSLPLPLPSLFEQKDIVTNLNKLSAETKLIEAIYQQKMTALAELKQCILQKAFSGKLTAEVPKVMEESVA